MSKRSKARSRHRKDRRKRKALVLPCQKCGTVPDSSAKALLSTLADSLNACEAAGLNLKLGWHGIVKSEVGYVLPMPTESDKWVARLMNYADEYLEKRKNGEIPAPEVDELNE